MPFQSQVNVVQAPAVQGDFASANPRQVVLAGPGGIVAGPAGVLVGLACWTTPPVDADNSPAFANNFGSGPITGILHREQQGLIEVYLQEASLLVPAGFPVTLFSAGDFWVKNAGSGQAQIGQKAYAGFSSGTWTFAATGSPTQSGTSTASSIAAETFSATGSIAGDVMAVTAVGSGTIYPGAAISGTNVASGSTVVSQLTPLLTGETTGGVGRYYVSLPEQTVASTTISGTYGLLTVGGTITGTWGVGSVVTGSGGGGVTTGTIITALGTGTGGAGTYVVNLTQTVTSSTIDATGNVETKWIAMSSGAAGELIKISSQPLG
jgi:hypothetical protein